MARPQRNTVDYFPFLCDEGSKMFCLEEKFGNDGFAVFLKILRALAKTEFHYLNLSEKKTLMFLSAKCKVSQDRLLEIISYCVELEKFNEELWESNRVIWCPDFIDSIQDAYKKRTNDCIDFKGLCVLLTRLGVIKQSKLPSEGPVKPQSKVKETKEENNISLNKKNSDLMNDILKSQNWIEAQCMRHRMDETVFHQKFSDFWAEQYEGHVLENTPKQQNDIKKHFNNTIKNDLKKDPTSYGDKLAEKI